MKFKKFIALICTFAFIWSNFINVSAGDDKVVLAGSSQAGKTKLREGMIGENFSDETIDMARCISVKTLAIFEIFGNDSLSKAVDCLQGARIVVICVAPDVTYNVECDVRHWKDLVAKHCRDAKIVLAANKWDLWDSANDNDKDTFCKDLESVAKKLGIDGIFYTSAKTGYKIDDFTNGLQRIARKVNAPPVTATPSPPSSPDALVDEAPVTPLPLTTPAANEKTPPSTDAPVNEPLVIPPTAPAAEKETLPRPNAPVFDKKMLIAVGAVGVGVIGMIGYFVKSWFSGNQSQNSRLTQ
ncbi:MAG: hypothetical protein LBR79_02175 [Oscillospiraceae bacterium]|jgi:GTPase SAR1 family protein|nr:hypothetical protein [Oscillospiraceae bacterium]